MRVTLLALTGVVAQVYVPGKTVVIQYGVPRTATSLQYAILTSLATLQCAQEGLDEPETPYVNQPPKGGFVPGAIYKTHNAAVVLALNKTTHALVFTTSSDAKPDAAAAELRGRQFAHVQRLADVERYASGVVADYFKFFDLTATNAAVAAKKIKTWDITRLCCSPQGSLHSRLQLHGCPPLRTWFDAMNPDCDLYDLDAAWRFSRFATAETAIDQPYLNPFTFDAGPTTCTELRNRIRAGSVSVLPFLTSVVACEVVVVPNLGIF